MKRERACQLRSLIVKAPASLPDEDALETGKYYSQSGVVYRCFRDAVNPIYTDLSALVGIYLEVIA